jgi:undecaprenyl-diphosphatase
VLAARQGAKTDGGRKLETLDYKEALVVGVAQSSALIAGISRDGVCMTAGLVRGLDHEDSARFAFLLATPIILAAGLFKLSDLTGPLGDGVRAPGARRRPVRRAHGHHHRPVPRRLLQDQDPDPFGFYCLAFGTAMADLHARPLIAPTDRFFRPRVGSPRREVAYSDMRPTSN